MRWGGMCCNYVQPFAMWYVLRTKIIEFTGSLVVCLAIYIVNLYATGVKPTTIRNRSIRATWNTGFSGC